MTRSAGRCARVVITELVSRGVREVVLAPGSRSAPLAYDVFELDRQGQLRLHVRVDERAAGFLALGLAKASEAPVAVVTTSGTAAANLHPAVLEAWHSHLPLFVITADRPRGMINTGANQTTHQDQLFTPHIRGAAQLVDDSDDPQSWRFELSRLLTAARGSRSRLPGPVHLNVSFSEPLTPDPAEPLQLDPAVTVEQQLRLSEPLRLTGSPTTVVIAGDCSPAIGQAALDLATTGRYPMLAEPSSNARRGPQAISCYRLLLGTGLAEQIERVIVFGHPTLSRPVTRLLSRPDIELIMVSPYADWVDPGRRLPLVVDAVEVDRAGDQSWLQCWLAADARLRPALDQLLDHQALLTGPALAGALWACLTDHDVLMAGSSNPVRDLDLAPITAAPPVVYANRGLSGIDGTISTAMGIALAIGQPTHALIGDLTFLHDLAGLIVGPEEPRADLRIVVANDDGGSIFATLEQGEPNLAAAFERVFATAHNADLAELVTGAGGTYSRVDGLGELGQVLAAPPRGIEVVEAPIDRVQRRALDQAMQALAADL
jgi:2-succinyl-5-enolpyruvyl-6-hydroxy-3-cyclohexene-1-carboxylate synthase